jgi:hypothetical protein
MTKIHEVAPIGRSAAVVLYVITWLLWSAVALRLDVDGALLGVVWFGAPLAVVLALRWYWNRYQAGKVEVLSTNNFHDLPPPRDRD